MSLDPNIAGNSPQRFSTPKARGRGGNNSNIFSPRTPGGDNSFSSFQVTPRGSHSGSPQTPHSGGFRGRGGGFRGGRGHFRGRGNNSNGGSILEYYHPAMLQDPWVSIERYRNNEGANVENS